MKKFSLVICTNIAAPYEVKLAPYLSRYFKLTYVYHSQKGAWRPEYWKVDMPCMFKRATGPILRLGSRYLSLGLFFDLMRAKPDVVIADDFFNPLSFICFMWAKLFGKTIFIRSETLRTANLYLIKSDRRVKLANRLYRNIDGVLAVSQSAKDQLSCVLPDLSARIFVLQGPIDIEAHLGHRPRCLTASGATLLFANSLQANYGPLVAIEVLRNVRLKFPSTKLIMNGVGPMRSECERLALSLGLKEAVEFTDQVQSWDELPDIYETADILILPATHSNGNASVLEAMASGMGIVVSDVIVYTSDFVRQNRGFVVRPTVEDFSEAVETYLKHPDLILKDAMINREAVQHRRFEPCASRYQHVIARELDLAELDSPSGDA